MSHQVAACECRQMLLLLIGAPASGKTSLTRALASKSANQHLKSALCTDREVFIHSLCFDDYLFRDGEKMSVKDLKEGEMKQVRFNAFSDVADMIQKERNTENEEQNGFHLFVVDDNMYYRSMRKPFYRLCRRNAVRFVQCIIPVDAAVAIARDQKRRTLQGGKLAADTDSVEESGIQVGEDTTLRLNALVRNDFPDPSTYGWEKQSIVYLKEDNFRSLENCQQERKSAEARGLAVVIDQEGLFSCLTEFWRHPDWFNELDGEDVLSSPALGKHEDRQRNAKNIRHQCDLMLRNQISILVKNAKNKGHENGALQTVANKANTERKRLLLQCEEYLDGQVVDEGELHMLLESVRVQFVNHVTELFCW